MRMSSKKTDRRDSVCPVRTARHTTLLTFLPAQSASVLQGALGSFIHLDSTPACKPPMQLALHCDDDGERFLSESKMLLYARTPEINADPTSPCILHENLPVS